MPFDSWMVRSIIDTSKDRLVPFIRPTEDQCVVKYTELAAVYRDRVNPHQHPSHGDLDSNLQLLLYHIRIQSLELL